MVQVIFFSLFSMVSVDSMARLCQASPTCTPLPNAVPLARPVCVFVRNIPVCHLKLKTEKRTKRESTTYNRGCKRVGCTRTENCAQMSFVPSFALFFWSLESKHAPPIICPHTPNNNTTRLQHMHQERACSSKEERERERRLHLLTTSTVENGWNAIVCADRER